MSHDRFREPSQADPSSDRSDRLRHATDALVDARRQLETVLAEQPAWCALAQLQSRSTDRTVRAPDRDAYDRLTDTLSALPLFTAWQFVDTALTFLAAEPRLPPPRETAKHVTTSTAQGESPPVVDAPTARPTAPPGLSTRIPTLHAHDRDFGARIAQVHVENAPPPSRAGGLFAETTADTRSEAADRPLPAYDDAGTRFVSEATGIEEAEVRIVVRQPPKPLIDARLPPSPFDERRPERGEKLPRASRATAVKWADDEDVTDFRPVSSAMDEAQVSIIATGAKPEADQRAERRALGVAPDREQHMRRFLKALSGE